MRRRAVVAVGAVVLGNEGRVLLVRRGHPPLAGSWSLPGGRVESGETLEHAVMREVREETGLTVRPRIPLGVVRFAREGFRYDIHEFACELDVPDERARAGDDAADARWAKVPELPALGVRRNVVALVRRALAAASRGYLPAE